MNEQEYYNTITQPSTAEFKDRGSKFIGYAFPIETIEEFKKQFKILKKVYKKTNY